MIDRECGGIADGSSTPLTSQSPTRQAGLPVRPLVIVVEPDTAQRRRLLSGLGRGVQGVADIADVETWFHSCRLGDGGVAHFTPLIVVSGPQSPPGSIVAALTAMAGSDGCDRRWWAVVGVVPTCDLVALRVALAAGVCDLVEEGAPVA